MPPKQRFTHEIILEKAYSMFLEGGMSAVNARSVSKALNCSTQPIFSYFPDMEGLRLALIQKGFDDFKEATESSLSSGASIIERACAYVRYAGTHARVFLYLLSQQNSETNPMNLLLSVSPEIIETESKVTGLSQEKINGVLRSLNAYIQGLAFFAANKIVSYDESSLQTEISKVYASLIKNA